MEYTEASSPTIVNVTCSVDATNGEPTFRIDYNWSSGLKFGALEKYKPTSRDLKYYFSGSIQEQIILYNAVDIKCTVTDERGEYFHITHIATKGMFLFC